MLDEFEYGLQLRSGAPGLLTIITRPGYRQDRPADRSPGQGPGARMDCHFRNRNARLRWKDRRDHAASYGRAGFGAPAAAESPPWV